MTESEYLEKLNQVDFDLSFLRKRLRTLDFNIAAADMVKNIPEVNKLRRYRKQLSVISLTQRLTARSLTLSIRKY